MSSSRTTTSASQASNLFAPGRLCLFGEHSDWAAEYGRHRGLCLVVGTDQGIRATAWPADNFCVESPVPNALGRPSSRRRRMECAWDETELQEAAQDQDEFFRYCAGVACFFLKRKGAGGLRLRISSMDLPLKKGVSSSAAAYILVAEAFDGVYGYNLLPGELMEMAYLGERLTGSQCGRMDQACVYGKTPVLLTFEAGNRVQVQPVQVGGEVQMFFVDLGGMKDTMQILADLQGAYEPTPVLQQALGDLNERIVRSALKALRAGKPAELGKLMTLAQEIFDRQVAPHCPTQLHSPLLHELLTLEDVRPHVYGGKGVGSQGDGTTQFVARSSQDRDLAMHKIQERFPQMRCYPLTIRPQPGRWLQKPPLKLMPPGRFNQPSQFRAAE